MKNSKFDDKKLEELSDEELLNICGGSSFDPKLIEFIDMSGMLFCQRKTTENECNQQEVCKWVKNQCKYVKKTLLMH